jgi:hypothetical protein
MAYAETGDGAMRGTPGLAEAMAEEALRRRKAERAKAERQASKPFGMSAYVCIKPQCPPDCSQCNHALPPTDEARILIADLLHAFAVDGHGGPFEDGECALVDRARRHLCRAE